MSLFSEIAMLTPYDTLEVICRRCLAGEMLEPDEMSWLGEALVAFINRRCRTIEEAMHLRAGRGGVPWRRECGRPTSRPWPARCGPWNEEAKFHSMNRGPRGRRQA